MIKHLRLGGLYLYISTTRLRPRQNREIGKEATERKRLKNQLIRERGQKCEICGFVGGGCAITSCIAIFQISPIGRESG